MCKETTFFVSSFSLVPTAEPGATHLSPPTRFNFPVRTLSRLEAARLTSTVITLSNWQVDGVMAQALNFGAQLCCFLAG